MNLQDYQRAIAALCLQREPDGASARALPAFGLYRHMIRTRFESMAKAAFRRTLEAVGERAFLESFARYLEHGPQSPLLREAIGAFATFALTDRALLAAAPPPLPDLLRFEAAVWRCSSDAGELPTAWLVREVDFDGVLVSNPTLAVLSLAYDVSQDGEPARDAHSLLIYRRAGEHEVHWYRAPAVLAALLAPTREEALEGDDAATPALTLAEQVRALFSARSADGSDDAGALLLQELAAALAVAVERGVILGVRDP